MNVESLHEDDFDRRFQFCEEMLMSFENDPGLMDKIIWSDEAIFRLDGQVNRHNCVYYAVDNPRFVQTKELTSPVVSRCWLEFICRGSSVHSSSTRP